MPCTSLDVVIWIILQENLCGKIIGKENPLKKARELVDCNQDNAIYPTTFSENAHELGTA